MFLEVYRKSLESIAEKSSTAEFRWKAILMYFVIFYTAITIWEQTRIAPSLSQIKQCEF